MLQASVERILRTVAQDALVLDVGGWARPFGRADLVLDLLPYETRGRYGRDGGHERFTRATWVQRDICDREPWPFADGQVDFAICSHTLEDVRDPVWVCSELNRVAKAGYIEVPSRLEEQSLGFQGPWVGWGHHHWLIDVRGQEMEFVFKHHVLHGRESDRFPASFHATLTAEQRVQQLWWEEGFRYRERVMVSGEELDPYLADFVRDHYRPQPGAGRRAQIHALPRGAGRRGALRGLLAGGALGRLRERGREVRRLLDRRRA